MAFTTKYSESYALVVGINDYKNISPLGYAVNDARSVSNKLIDLFSFPKKNVTLLIDNKATKTTILKKYLRLRDCDSDARVFVFFAGHGHTIDSYKGDVGYLVPWNGDPKDLSTLIRWDELTQNSYLIPAKHMLFVMDACYGGLAVTRSSRPGSMRFLTDMLRRRSRQVVTAGKGDETVADLGGPLPGHSVFTGHLLEGMDGAASSAEGVLTANGLMSYVYDKVGQDAGSFQTPHFGYLDGDGDFIFSNLDLLEEEKDESVGEEGLIAVPYPQTELEEAPMSSLDEVKEYLDDPTKRIKLHDKMVSATRGVLAALSEDEFPVGEKINEDFLERLNRYEDVISEVASMAAIMAYWASSSQTETLLIPFQQISGRIKHTTGNGFWIALRWYPLLVLTYLAGIGAVASNNYSNLKEILHLPIDKLNRPFEQEPFALGMFDPISHTFDQFKRYEEYKKKFVPKSEYLHKVLQPKLDDLFFLGNQYDNLFDRFEVIFCLEHAHLYQQEFQRNFWGPIGRFGWKQRRQGNLGPLGIIKQEAKRSGDNWPPLNAGLFGGSIDRFNEVHDDINSGVKQLGWW